MKSAPKVLEHLLQTNELFIVDLHFTNNITILMSGVGKSTVFSFIKEECMAINPRNLFTTKDNLFEFVSEKNGEQTKFSIREYL